MKTFRTLLFFFSVCAFAGLLFGSDSHGYVNHSGDSYENGYVRGYQHGSEDVQARLNFDFQHGTEYQNSGNEHARYDTNGSCEVRNGYLEGYVDGYFRHQARFESNDNYGHGNNYGYGGNTDGYSGSDNSVVAFTQRGYAGQSQQFRIGQYAHLDGQMNDNIESITVRGNVRVTLFDSSNFGGQRIVLDHDFSDLGNFRSKAASMIVESLYTQR